MSGYLSVERYTTKSFHSNKIPAFARGFPPYLAAGVSSSAPTK